MAVKQADLPTAISDIIQNLALMTVEQVDEFADFKPDLCGSIDFTGPVCGRLSVRCTKTLPVKLAANLLGIEQQDQVTQANSLDALAELLNVVCGNIVTIMFDEKKTFILSIPQVHEFDAEQKEEVNCEIVRLLMEGQEALFTLTTNPGA